ncbi:MAG: divergent PAP2 family protein [Defluviitaleaceae bacterium]|nr:divergent PAP2 family protein [Defluviitaleaceae bacterium]
MVYPNAFVALINNSHLLIAIFACLSAQALKVLIDYGRTKTVDKALFFGTGGMPSSHSAFVVSMAASIGTVEGLHSSMFAIALVFALIVMYDAAGVRRAAGKHAEVINMLVESLENIGITPDEKLKELLGHSPIEVVAGALWGVAVAAISHGFLIR